jgi:hypothetical protein
MDATAKFRYYSGSDGNMLSAARAIHTQFSQDIAAFSALDSGFTPAYLSGFEGLINAAQGLASDDLVIDQVAEKSEAVERVWAAACSKYGELRYFVLQAFPASKGVQNQFGLGNYSSYARRSAARMLRLMQDLHKVATSYKTELLAVGYSQAKIDDIDTIAQQLEDAISAQSLAKKERPKTTADRVSALNACYERMMQVNAAAQIVYMQDAAKRSQYTFYQRRAAPKKDESEAVAEQQSA